MMPRMPPQHHHQQPEAHGLGHGHGFGHQGLPFQHPFMQRHFPHMNPALAAEQPAKKSPPLERKARHGVEISDLRQDNLTEADARQLLSTFVVIRMEKSINQNDLDEVGKPLKPTWERAIRTEETDVSQHEATRKVRELDKKTDPVVDKKAELSTVVQRQIEKAQESLEKHEEDDRYEYVLAQFESKTREIDEKSPLFKTYGQKKDKDKKAKAAGKGDKADKGKHSKTLERVSVTAYFKRMPRRDQNALKMFEEKKKRAKGEKEKDKEKEPAAKPPNDGAGPGPQPMPVPPFHFPPPQMMMPPGQGPPQVFADLPQGQGFPIPEQGQGEPGVPDVEMRNPRGGGVRIYVDRPRSSGSSYTSEESWDSDEESELITPESSVGSSSRRSYRKYKDRERRHHDRPENFGLEVPRRHNRKDQDYVTSGTSPPAGATSASPRPRTLPQPSVNIGTILKQAYRDGCDDTEATLRPLVVQRSSSPGYRPISSTEARRAVSGERLDEMEDEIARLRIDDERRRERERRIRRDQEYRNDRLADELERERRFSSRLSGRFESRDDLFPGVEVLLERRRDGRYYRK